MPRWSGTDGSTSSSTTPVARRRRDAATASPRFSASIVKLNLLAPLHCAQAANAVMQEPGGRRVDREHHLGERHPPVAGTAAYGAAKAGLINLTQTLAVEWAPKVRVNALSAGLVATEAADDYYGGAEGMAAVAATVPLGRFGTPEDMAGICLFLASPLAAYVSGANLVAHGGGEWPAFLAAAAEAARPGLSASGHSPAVRRRREATGIAQVRARDRRWSG